MDLRVLEREVGSMPMRGPKEVLGVPALSMFMSIKPAEIVNPCAIAF
jgi:hypothetical protein